MENTDFEKIWQEDIRPFLRESADDRFRQQEFLKWGLAFIFSASIALIPFSGGFGNYWWLMVAGIPLSIYTGQKLHSAFGGNFTKEFKRKVVDSLSQYTDFDWQIHCGSEFSEKQKEAAQNYLMYEYEYHFFSENDNPDESDAVRYLMGADGRKTFKESGLYANYNMVKSKDKLTSNWRNSTIAAYETLVSRTLKKSSVTVFRGFIIKAEVNTELRGETYVQTEEDDGSVADEDWFNKEGVQETELEWTDFEKFLEVKSSDPVETRQIFTPDFMEVVYDWWQDHNKPLRMTFKNQAVYIAYPTDTDLEPGVAADRDSDKKAVKDIFELLLFIENIVKTIVGGQPILSDKQLTAKRSEKN